MAKRAAAQPKGKQVTEAETVKAPRERVVDALMGLAAERRFDDIDLIDIAAAGDVSLADLRDLFPSKGAILGAFMRTIDRQVLSDTSDDMAGEKARDRLMDVMLRRFDALAPHREGLRSIWRSVRHDPGALLALNGAALNTWRYMLAAAGIETSGAAGMVRTQGAALVFARTFPIWLDDEADLARTMSRLDKELRAGENVLGMVDAVARFAAPFQGFTRALCERRRRSSRNAEYDAHG